MANDNIKKLYDEASSLHAQAKSILVEFEGKDLPKEKSEQVDALFDQVEAKTKSAKQLERGEEQEKFLHEPDEKNKKNMFGDKGDPDEGGGDPAKKKRDAIAMGAFTKVLKGGDRAWAMLSKDELAAIAPEGKALSADDAAAGGTLVAPQVWVNQLLKNVDDEVFVRGLTSNKFQLPSAQSLGVPSLDTDVADGEWTSEVQSVPRDSSAATGKRELFPHLLTKEVLISRRLLRQSSINADALIRQRLAYKLGVPQEKAFMTGSGAEQPLGVFTASVNGISTGRDTTAASTTTFTGDELIDTAYNLKPQYLKNSTWLFHRSTLKVVRKLKATTGDYLWQPGLAGDKQPTILERPYVLSEFAPSTLTAAQYVAMLADWNFYWIADALSMEIQVVDQLYAKTNQMGYIGRLETDGMPVLEEAFSRLILHA
jgi:HK97 family phage major capsid protein